MHQSQIIEITGISIRYITKNQITFKCSTQVRIKVNIRKWMPIVIESGNQNAHRYPEQLYELVTRGRQEPPRPLRARLTA